MSLSTEAAKSVSDSRVLVQLDIGQDNIQWVNIGAGIWETNANNIYSYVDATLMPADFSAQLFGVVGSVQVSGRRLAEADTLLDMATTDQQFFYNKSSQSLYVRAQNSDEPYIHTVSIGIINGYSFDEFSPDDIQNVPYKGRLTSLGAISIDRDPLFFGRLVFGGGSVTIANNDGDLDTFGQETNIYGNQARVFFGFPSITFANYHQFYTGYIGKVRIGEEAVSVAVSDLRKQLTRPITHTTVPEKNGVEEIQEIITTYFPAAYNSTYFNLTDWPGAVATVGEFPVNIEMQKPEPAIKMIEQLALSVFGFLVIDPDGRYSFKLVDTSASAETTIRAVDIMSRHEVVYDPTEVVSSVRVGYAKDWLTNGTAYTYYTDDTRETSVFNAYKTYNEQTFDTLLTLEEDAQELATQFLDYFDTVKGRLEVEVPMSYYESRLGDIADVEIERSQDTMIGTTKSEIISVRYALNKPSIMLGLRFV